MNNYKTEISQDKDKILVISDNLSFGLKLKKKLEKSQIEVVLVQKFRIIDWLKLKKRIFPREFTKIIIAIFENDFFFSQKEHEEILKFLKKRKEQIFFLTSYLTPILNEQKIFEKWKRQQQKQKQFLLEIDFSLPKANIIVGQNMVFLDNPKKLPMSFFYDFYKEGIINDLNENISLICDEDFLEFTNDYLFTPFEKLRILVKNKEIESKKITRFILLKNNFKNINYQIFQANLKKNNDDDLNYETKKVNYSIEKILDKSLISLPPVKNIIGYQNNVFVKKNKESFKNEKEALRKITFLKEELFKKEEEKPKKIIKKEKNKSSNEEIKIETENDERKNNKEKNDDKTKKKKKIKKRKNNKKKGKEFIKIAITICFFVFLGFNFFYFKIIEKELFRRLANDKFSKFNNYQTTLIKLWKKRPKIEGLYKNQNKVYNLALAYNEFGSFEEKILEEEENIYNYVFKKGEDKGDFFKNFSENDFDFIDLLERQEYEINQELKKKIIKNKKNEVNLLNNLSQLWSEFVKKDQHNILLLFLDEQQARSQGGVIDLSCLLSFRQGKLIDIQILKSNEIDYLIGKKILISKKWNELNEEKQAKFKDLTFYNDFNNTASSSALIAEEVYKKKINQIFSFDIKTLENLIDVFDGEVELDSLHEIINKNNIYDRFLFYSNNGNKIDNRDFSKIFIETILRKLSNLEKEKMSGFWKTLYQSLENKNSYFYSLDEGENSIFKNLNWGGGINLPDCQKLINETSCYSDRLFNYDNSLGDNKVNYFIKKYTDLKININQKSIEHIVEINYQNDANSYAWPLGNYNFYGQYLLPQKAENLKVFIDDLEINEFSETMEGEFKKIELEQEVTLKNKKRIKISYLIPVEINSNEYWQYSFFKNNQAILGDDYGKITINYPSDFELTTITPQATYDIEHRIVSFEGIKEKKDYFINVLFYVK